MLLLKVEIENVLDCGEHDHISVDEIYLKKDSQYLKVRLVGFKLPEEESNKNRMELCRRAKNNKKTDKPKEEVKLEENSTGKYGFDV